MESRLTVRQQGTVKKRRLSKYAIDVLREDEFDNCCGMLALLAFLQCDNDPEMKNKLLLCAGLLASESENIRKEVSAFSTPVERRYLRFATDSLQESFTVHFRFRNEFIIRVAKCLQIPADFQLDNGSWVNGQEGLLILLKMMSFPQRLVDVEGFFGWEMSRLSRILKFLKKLIYTRHKHRLEDYWHWHCEHILIPSRDAILSKKIALHPQGAMQTPE